MIRRFIHLAAVAACALGFTGEASAHPGYNNGPAFVPPPPPAPIQVVVRPPCPSRSHVWYDGRWVWAGNQYTWSPGYWGAPQQVVYAPPPYYAPPPRPVYYSQPYRTAPAYYGPVRPGYGPGYGQTVVITRPPPQRVVVVR